MPPSQIPPDAQIINLLFGKFISQAITVMARLGVADQLAAGPLPAETIAARVGADGESLYRTLRALSVVGVVREDAGRVFSLLPAGETLRSDHPHSTRAMAQWLNLDISWQAWGAFEHSVRTGRPAFDHVFGSNVFDHFAGHPEAAQVFDRAMTGFSHATGRAVAETDIFAGIGELVDIGGGQGFLLAAILRRNPGMRGAVLDLPHVVPQAAALFAAEGVADRARALAGSFLEAVPPADAYVMKFILHDWDDATCVGLLSRCRSGLRGQGRVLVVETVVPPPGEPGISKLLDLEMLAMTPGGRERTADQFTRLFAAAGLRLQRILPTASPVHILEAVPG